MFTCESANENIILAVKVSGNLDVVKLAEYFTATEWKSTQSISRKENVTFPSEQKYQTKLTFHFLF